MKRTYFLFLLVIALSISATAQDKTQNPNDTNVNTHAQESNWYLSIRLSKKNFLHSNRLAATLSPPDRGYYGGYCFGHYLNSKLAIELGLQYYTFMYSAPFEVAENPDYGMMRYELLSFPLSVRYDIIRNERIRFYGKATLSADKRISSKEVFLGSGENLATVDISDNDLSFNADVETGIDFRIFRTIRLGAFLNWTQAFQDAVTLEYSKIDSSQQPFIEQILLNNTHLGFGIELKIDL